MIQDHRKLDTNTFILFLTQKIIYLDLLGFFSFVFLSFLRLKYHSGAEPVG